MILRGDIDPWPPKADMASVLRRAGVPIYVGPFSIRVEGCFHFVFQQYGGDIGNPVIDAEGESLSALIGDAERISRALAAADVKHWFEVCDDDEEPRHYIHHHWPEAIDDTA